MPNLLHDSDSGEDDERKNSKWWSTRHTTFFFPGAGQLFIGKHFLDGDVVQNGNYKYLQEFIHTCNKNIVSNEMCYRGRKLGNLNFYQTVLALLRISLSKCTQFPAVWRERERGWTLNKTSATSQ